MEWYKDGMYPEWFISGKIFSPKILKIKYPKLILTACYEKEDRNKTGRNKAKERGYGSCVVVVPENIIDKLDWLLRFILKEQKEIRKIGVDKETIWITWYGVQGNMELNPKQLEKLNMTGNQLNMNYYYIKNE